MVGAGCTGILKSKTKGSPTNFFAALVGELDAVGIALVEAFFVRRIFLDDDDGLELGGVSGDASSFPQIRHGITDRYVLRVGVGPLEVDPHAAGSLLLVQVDFIAEDGAFGAGQIVPEGLVEQPGGGVGTHAEEHYHQAR